MLAWRAWRCVVYSVVSGVGAGGQLGGSLPGFRTETPGKTGEEDAVRGMGGC
jgi:hypothetical protein